MDERPTGGHDGGDDAPDRRKAADADGAPPAVDVFGDRRELPVLVALFALAVASESIASLFYCRC
jgi:hypothetical protein